MFENQRYVGVVEAYRDGFAKKYTPKPRKAKGGEELDGEEVVGDSNMEGGREKCVDYAKDIQERGGEEGSTGEEFEGSHSNGSHSTLKGGTIKITQCYVEPDPILPIPEVSVIDLRTVNLSGFKKFLVYTKSPN